MPPEIDQLRAAGFSDSEIGDWASQYRAQLSAAGFSDADIDEHFDAARLPGELPKPFLDRFLPDNAAGRIAKRTAEYAAIGFGDAPVGLSPDTLQLLKDNGVLTDYKKRSFPTPSTLIYDNTLLPVSIIGDAALRGLNAAITAAGAGIGQTAEEVFGTSMAPGIAARDFSQLFNIGAMFWGAVPGAALTSLRPRLPYRGGLPPAPTAVSTFASSLRDAAEILPGDLSISEKEQRLLRVWNEHGIHPAEVAERAQDDPTILQRLFSNEATADGASAIPQTFDTPGQGVRPELRHGLPPELRVKADIEGMSLPTEPPLHPVKSLGDARQQIGELNDIFAAHPNADKSIAEWNRRSADALGTDDVPIPPSALIEDLNSEKAVENMRKLTPAQLKAAQEGAETTRQIRAAYLNGEMQVEHTGKLFLWSFLSRNLSPLAHESIFIDAFRGVGRWIKKAASGEFSDADLPEYEAWAKQVAPKGSLQPAATATSNLINFGRQFLLNMGKRTEEGGPTLLQQAHNMISDVNMTGKDIRRWFAGNVSGSGAGNKVVSLALLGGGFSDVAVLDRVMVNALFKDARLGDSSLYSCCKINGKPIEGSGLSAILSGPMGVFNYESVESAVAGKVHEIYAALGRAGDASVGRWHWENWQLHSGREVAHEPLKLLLRGTEDGPRMTAGITAREGRFKSYQYGSQYGRDAADNPYMKWSSPLGEDYQFSLDQYRNFMGKIKDYREGVVPKGFKVTEATDAPWYHRPGVNQQRLDGIAKEFGTPVRVR